MEREPCVPMLRIFDKRLFFPFFVEDKKLIRGSWKLGRIVGIDLSVHWSFLLLLLWVLMSSLAAGGLSRAVGETVFISLLFGCVVLHELGHALAARAFGIPTHGITLLPIGGVAQLDRIPRNPWQEFAIAVAGPAVNIVIAALLFPLVIAFYGLGQITPWGLIGGGFVVRLLLVNIVLVVFNLIPAFPMDGGRVLRSILAMGMADYGMATRWAVRVGQVMAGLLGIAALLYLQNPMLLLIAAFVFFAAESELRQATQDRVDSGPTAASLERLFPSPSPSPLERHPLRAGFRPIDMSKPRRDAATVPLVIWLTRQPIGPRD